MVQHMTALTEWFCNFCNASAQRREEGDEASTGYERTLDSLMPDGWWEVPGMGPGRVGHACPDCILTKPDVRERVTELRSKGLDEVLRERLPDDTLHPAWPAQTSPFGGQVG